MSSSAECALRAGRPKGKGVNPQATEQPVIQAPQGASSLQLYQLKTLIEGMLAD